MTTPDFATRLYERLSIKEAGKNLFFSPFSIQVALAMCGRGAKGETRKVMAELVGAPLNIALQDSLYKELLATINGDGSERPFELVTANALWGQEDYDFHAEYTNAIEENYDGAFNVVNYKTSPDEAVVKINKWVSEKTKEKIKELISRSFIDEDTRLILTNAIYFKGKWAFEFKKTATKEEDFFGFTGTTKVQMMHQEKKHYYYEAEGYQAVDLLYKGEQLSLLVVLPTKNFGLPNLETRWNAEGLYQHVTENLYNQEVILSLPRFKMETKFKLKPVLIDMGAEIAFLDDADFTLIGEEKLKISEVIHKAFVEVNEEGTEAAAATAVGMMRAASMSMPPPPKVFNADHPFLFFIRDRETNTILFSGRANDPK